MNKTTKKQLNVIVPALDNSNKNEGLFTSLNNLDTQMKLNFLPNDCGNHELGFIIPSITLQNKSTLKSISIEFHDLLTFVEEFKKGNSTYLIKDSTAVSGDASSVGMNDISQDIVVTAIRKGDFLHLFTQYSQINNKFDVNDIKDTQVFIVVYKQFIEYVAVVENCIFSDAYIQSSISRNLSTLSTEMKRLMPKLLNSYVRQVAYYTEEVSKKKSNLLRRDVLTLVANRIQTLPGKIESNVVFSGEHFTDFPETFFLSIEQFDYIGTQLLKGNEPTIHAQNTIAKLSFSKDKLRVSAVLIRDSEDIWEFILEINRELFLSMYKIISQTLFLEAESRINLKNEIATVNQKSLLTIPFTDATLEYIDEKYINDSSWNEVLKM